MPATNHRVDLVNPRGLLDLTDRIDDPGMATGGDDDQAPILDMIGRRVLAPENVGHQLAGLGLDLQRPRGEVQGSLTPRTRWSSLQTRRGRRLLEIDETRNLA